MNETILITNGRFAATLDLIRNLAKNGHRVIVAETSLIHYCSTSNANAKNIIIPSPREDEEGYITKILTIIEEEEIDLFIPAWEDVLIVSKHIDRFPEDVAFTSNFSLVKSLHNKWEFSNLITKMGYKTPSTILINNQEDLQSVPFTSFYVKTCYSRGSEKAFLVNKRRNTLQRNITETFPFLVQENQEGRQYCTYSICHKGKIKAHSTYPIHYLKFDPNKSRGQYCLSFEEVSHDAISTFVMEFAQKTNYTGSLAFDIFDHEGELSILECNPRLTSGITLLTSHLNLSEAFFGTNSTIFVPKQGERGQYLFPSLFFATKSSIKNGSFKPFIKTIFNTKDLIFHRKDIMPFLFQPLIGFYHIVLKFRYKKSIISAYSHDLDYEG